MSFMHFHNSGTRNRDHLILLIKTGNAHKKIILPQIVINTCEREGIETLSKMIVETKWRLLYN